MSDQVGVGTGGMIPPSQAGVGGRGAATVFVLRILSAGLMLALQVLLARLMTQADFGIYVLIWTWLLALASFAGFGFPEAAVRFLPRYLVRKRGRDLWGFFWVGLAVIVFGATIAAALMVVASTFIPSNHVARFVLIVVAAGLPFLALEYFLEGCARSFGWVTLTTGPSYVLRPLLIGLGVGFAAMLGVTIDGSLVAVILIVSMVAISSGLLILVVLRMHKLAKPAEPSAVTVHRARHWFVASLPLLAVSGFEDLLTYSDVVLLGMLVTAEEVAVYFAAARSMALASFVYYAFYMVAGRGFSLAVGARDRELLQARVHEATRLTFWCTLGALIVTLAAGQMVLSLFGPAFQTGYTVMLILAAGFLARSASGQAADLMIITGRARIMLSITVAALLLNLMATLLLTPWFGIEGAAAATALTMALRAAGLSWAAWNYAGISMLQLPITRLSQQARFQAPS